MSSSWTAVLPVKRTSVAKTRLAGTDDAMRQRLALAFAIDTATAALACSEVESVLVVTDDEDAAAAVRDVGATAIPDTPDAGLNAALVHGAAVALTRSPGNGVALLSADLPALRPAELARALRQCLQHPHAFVSDAVGTGTTMLTGGPHSPPTPHYGPRSRAWHRSAGCVEITDSQVASLRRDVDTWVDLWDAERLGLGAATVRVLGLS